MEPQNWRTLNWAAILTLTLQGPAPPRLGGLSRSDTLKSVTQNPSFSWNGCAGRARA